MSAVGLYNKPFQRLKPKVLENTLYPPTIAVLLGLCSKHFFIKIFVEMLWKIRKNIIGCPFVSKR
jgi:hypothetical protein